MTTRLPSNYAVNATVLASRRLQGKRRATRPARYRERYTDTGTRTGGRRRTRLLVPDPFSAFTRRFTDTMMVAALNDLGFGQRASRSGASGARKLPVSPPRSGFGVSHPSADAFACWCVASQLRQAPQRCDREANSGQKEEGSENTVKDFPYNNAVNATVRPVTPLAVASGAPVRPARYRGRWADLKRS